MTFGEKNTWKIGGLDQVTVDKMVKHAVDAGVNLFDTADIYDEGESEKALGKKRGDVAVYDDLAAFASALIATA